MTHRLDLPALGLGTAALGDLYRQAPEEEAVATIRAAVAAGITYLDTAPHYALGVAEQRLGAALAGIDRDTVVVSTKVGRLLVPSEEQPGWLPALRRVWDFSADGVRRSLAGSLERLRLDRVDAVYLHDPEGHLDQAVEEGLPALCDLRDEGVVRAIGVGTGDPAAALRLVRTGALDLVLLAGRYTLLDRSAADELLPACLDHEVTVVLGGVYNSGLLADPSPGAHFDYRPAPPELLARARALADLCERHGTSLRAAALQFPLRHPAVGCILLGAGDPAQLADSLGQFAAPVPVELWNDLDTQEAPPVLP